MMQQDTVMAEANASVLLLLLVVVVFYASATLLASNAMCHASAIS